MTGNGTRRQRAGLSILEAIHLFHQALHLSHQVGELLHIPGGEKRDGLGSSMNSAKLLSWGKATLTMPLNIRQLVGRLGKAPDELTESSTTAASLPSRR